MYTPLNVPAVRHHYSPVLHCYRERKRSRTDAIGDGCRLNYTAVQIASSVLILLPRFGICILIRSGNAKSSPILGVSAIGMFPVWTSAYPRSAPRPIVQQTASTCCGSLLAARGNTAITVASRMVRGLGESNKHANPCDDGFETEERHTQE